MPALVEVANFCGKVFFGIKPLPVLFFAFEEGWQVGGEDGGIRFLVSGTLDEFTQSDGGFSFFRPLVLVLSTLDGAAYRRNEVAPFRHDEVFVTQVQVVGEGFS